MIVDNVDRKYNRDDENFLTYDIQFFLSFVDHEYIMIIFRFFSFDEIEISKKIKWLNIEQIFEFVCDRSNLSHDIKNKKFFDCWLRQNVRFIKAWSNMNQLIKKLNCFSLTLMQTNKYMREFETNCLKYLKLYENLWTKLMTKMFQLRNYENENIQIIWIIFYRRVKHANSIAIKLLQLWIYLNYQNVWYEMFFRDNRNCQNCRWFQDLKFSEIEFKRIMSVLLAYSLIESRQNMKNYSIHFVVHDWCAKTINDNEIDFLMLVFLIIDFVVFDFEEKYWLLQRRLISHVERCMRQFHHFKSDETMNYSKNNDVFHQFELFFVDQDKLIETKKMYRRTLNKYEKTWNVEHTSTFDIVNNLNVFFKNQNKLIETKKMYQRALNEYEKTWNVEHTSTFRIVNNLRLLHVSRNEFMKAKKIHRQTFNKNDETRDTKQYSQFSSSTIKTVWKTLKANMKKRKRDIAGQWIDFRDS